MSPHAPPAPEAGGRANPDCPGRRLPWHILVPAFVLVAVGGLLIASAGSALRPAAPVRVHAVVFDRTQAAPESAPGEDRDAAPTRAVQAPGWLEAEPFRIACAALADGVVDEMLVLEGERVEAGDIVARLVATDAELAARRAEAELAAAEAELALASAALDAAQADWEHPVERERSVAVALAALAETEAELAQLPSLIEAEVASLDSRREELTRSRTALASGAATDIEIIVLEKQVEAQAAAIDALRRREAILQARRARLDAELTAARRAAELRIEERRALDQAAATVAAAEAALAQARAQRDEARLRLERMTIRAPISGYVQRRLKAPGDKVMMGMDDPHSAHLVHLYDPSRLQARVDVPLADASHVAVGQHCEVVVEVLPDRTFAGEVTRITHEADLQKNTLQVKVRIIDPSPMLRPEMLTRVKFLPREPAPANGQTANRQSILVPKQALARPSDHRQQLVYAIRERRADRGVARAVPVSVLSVDSGWARVRAELHPGDLVALDPASLDNGDHVRVLPDRAQAPAGKGTAR